MNRLKRSGAAVSVLLCAGALLLFSMSGCWSIHAYSKHEAPVVQTGGRIVIAINWHERLENFSNDVPSGKPIWQGSVDYEDSIPLPGSSGRSAQRLSDRLIEKLAEDGFLVPLQPIAGAKAPASAAAE